MLMYNSGTTLTLVSKLRPYSAHRASSKVSQLQWKLSQMGARGDPGSWGGGASERRRSADRSAAEKFCVSSAAEWPAGTPQ